MCLHITFLLLILEEHPKAFRELCYTPRMKKFAWNEITGWRSPWNKTFFIASGISLTTSFLPIFPCTKTNRIHCISPLICMCRSTVRTNCGQFATTVCYQLLNTNRVSWTMVWSLPKCLLTNHRENPGASYLRTRIALLKKSYVDESCSSLAAIQQSMPIPGKGKYFLAASYSFCSGISTLEMDFFFQGPLSN